MGPYRMAFDRHRLWWDVFAPTGAVILSVPSSGSLMTDAKVIENRMRAAGLSHD